MEGLAMGKWISNNRRKYLLQYHLIFVCKYRKKLLAISSMSEDIKQFSLDISTKHGVAIKYMETDKDHIHYMIETNPNTRLSDFVRTLKSYAAYHIWERRGAFLKHHFWKEHTFWTDGYFICSVGNVSEETLKKYIEEQG
jgi:putative transposase